MGKSASTPTPPDPYTVANAQYGLGTKTASYNKALGNNSTSNALGGSNWTQTGTDPRTGAPQYGFKTSLGPQFDSLLQKPLDLSGIYGSGGGENATLGGNQNIRDALYKQQTQYLDPQFARKNTSLDAQLAAMGAGIGSDAYKNAHNVEGEQENQAYGNADLNAITGATGQQAQLQNINLGGLQAQEQQQNQPINLFNALNAGSGSGGSGQVATPNIQDAFNQQYQGQLNSANAQNASNNQTMGTLGSLAGMAMFMSDRRLKDDITPIGKLDNGLTVYKFRYKGTEAFTMGVMADEVEKILPHAVGTFDGYKAVNYGAL
jgi:hypothetical protein